MGGLFLLNGPRETVGLFPGAWEVDHSVVR